jgi:bifunctional non-homologous end joining protein LigD
VLKRTAFIVPSAPVLKRAPPSGPEWLHEVKHDGWRAQLHRHDAGATILSKSGQGHLGALRRYRLGAA